MAVLESRQVVVWSVPTLALVLSLLWLRRRRRERNPADRRSDSPSGSVRLESPVASDGEINSSVKSVRVEELQSPDARLETSLECVQLAEVKVAEEPCVKSQVEFSVESFERVDLSREDVEEVECSRKSPEEVECSQKSLEEVECSKKSPEEVECFQKSPEEVECSQKSPEEVECSQKSPEEVECSQNGLKEAECSQKTPEEVECSQKSPEEVECSQKSPEEVECSQKSLEEVECSQKGPEEVECFQKSPEKVECFQKSPEEVECSQNSPEEVECSQKSPEEVEFSQNTIREVECSQKKSPKEVGFSQNRIEEIQCSQESTKVEETIQTCVQEGSAPRSVEVLISSATIERESSVKSARVHSSRKKIEIVESPKLRVDSQKDARLGKGKIRFPEKKSKVVGKAVEESRAVMVKEEGGVKRAQKKEEEMEKGVLEEKLASLVLDTMKREQNGKQSAERDSANQSPSEVMLASPSISNFSDAHSEGSSDSGKGHSDVATSPSRTPAGGSSLAGDSAFCVYEFVLPQVIVGRLIGRHGSFIHEIRTSTQTNIFIKRHPDTSKLKICAIEGAQQDIDKALAKIRQKFPIRRFPKLTLEKVSFVSLNTPPPLKLEDFHLQLVEGVNNDVIISSLISAAHFFVQQPMHPTYAALSRLNQVMNSVYSNAEAPVLETPVKDAVCAAPTMGGWYRAQIVKVDEEKAECDVRFLDYGGYLTLESSLLRQIRGDLLMLPFQAVECYLANIVPTGEDGWPEEARILVQGLTQGQLLQAQIYDYDQAGTPLVYLYSALRSQIVLINEELVERGFASLVSPPAEE